MAAFSPPRLMARHARNARAYLGIIGAASIGILLLAAFNAHRNADESVVLAAAAASAASRVANTYMNANTRQVAARSKFRDVRKDAISRRKMMEGGLMTGTGLLFPRGSKADTFDASSNFEVRIHMVHIFR